MIAIILAFCVFLFIVKNLRFIIGCTIALLIAGFIMGPAHAQTIDMRNHPSAQVIAAQMQAVQPPVLTNSNSYEYQMMAFRSFGRACETTGDPQFCIASNDAYTKAMDIRAQANYIAAPKSRYQQLDEACRGGHGDDPQTRKACKKRDAMDKAGK